MSSPHPIPAGRAAPSRAALATVAGAALRLAVAWLAYAGFVVTMLYLAGWLAGVGTPTSVDRSPGPLGPPLVVDLLLVVAFGLQHSVMARAGFKRRLARLVPRDLERSVFVAASAAMLALLFVLWRPVPALVWDVRAPWLAAVLRTAYVLGWVLALVATFAISHAELFGLAAVHERWRARGATFRTPALYRVVRHPMHAGILVALWATPRMTLGHLVFALAMSAYVGIGIWMEERDLARTFGARYLAYRERVPALVPLPRRRRTGEWTAAGMAAALAVAGVGGAAASRRAEAREATHAPPLARVDLDVGGRARTAAVHVPAVPRPRPALVLALHGSGGSAGRLRGFLGGTLERAAERDGFVVAYPEGWEGGWNSCRVGDPARRAGADDVAFVRALVARLAATHGVDTARVFALGFSGGAQMAYRLALEAPALVRAVAAVGASLPSPSACAPATAARPVGVMIVNGTDDLVNPHEGGDVVGPLGARLGRVLSSSESARWLAARAMLPPAGPPARLLGPAHPGGTAVDVRRWARPGGGPEVALYTVEGGGHTIPGARTRLPRALGAVERRFETVEEALAFFQRQ